MTYFDYILEIISMQANLDITTLRLDSSFARSRILLAFGF